jgi:exopolyphosphatase / guanosine-5'-triphosphate,3'-diphosphate pyrophosphatase
VAELLGRAPLGEFTVVVRGSGGEPLVIRNAPFLDDGTPMPTRYWLVGRQARLAVDRLESAGGVRAAEAAVDPVRLAAAHAAYAAERDAAIPAGWTGPRPTGGVGGTRTGVKCLHAHYAWFLAGGPDPVGRWVAGRLGGIGSLGAVPGAPAAAIDCGTNSTRLLVAYPRGPIIESINRITRLGQGVDQTRRLNPEAIERTLAVLREFKRIIDQHGVDRVRMTATSAARDAVNREEFFAPAEQIVGLRPELLAGDEEGRLSFAGATSDLDSGGGPWLIVDIGGGSTELVVGPGPDGGPLAVRSLDMGCVRVTERFLLSDPPDPEQMEEAREFSSNLLEQAVAEEPRFRLGHTLVGLAGTVSALARLDEQLEVYDRDKLHHHLLTAARVAELRDSLAAVSSDERRKRRGMEPGRADVIVGGAIVLAEVMHQFGFTECLTSEADILDGLVLSTAVES